MIFVAQTLLARKNECSMIVVLRLCIAADSRDPSSHLLDPSNPYTWELLGGLFKEAAERFGDDFVTEQGISGSKVCHLKSMNWIAMGAWRTNTLSNTQRASPRRWASAALPQLHHQPAVQIGAKVVVPHDGSRAAPHRQVL